MNRVGKTFAALGLMATMFAIAPAAHASTQTGVASWYQMGTKTANGERYNPDGMTAAHRSLPFGTIVEVKNLRNGRTVRLRINDRGPFVGGRIIDVSRGGARALGLMGSGTAKVRVTAVSRGATRSRSRTASAGTSSDFGCVTRDCF